MLNTEINQRKEQISGIVTNVSQPKPSYAQVIKNNTQILHNYPETNDVNNNNSQEIISTTKPIKQVVN